MLREVLNGKVATALAPAIALSGTNPDPDTKWLIFPQRHGEIATMVVAAEPSIIFFAVNATVRPLDDVESFSDRYGIVLHLKTAIGLARRFFDSTETKCEIDTDRETGSSWVTINVVTRGKSRQEARGSYKEFVKAFVTTIPPAARELICLSYNIR